MLYNPSNPPPPVPPSFSLPKLPENVKFLLQVLLSLLSFGVAWATNNSAAVVMAVAIIFTYALNWLARYVGYKPTRNTLTGALFVVCLGLAVLFNPALLPPFVPPVDAEQMNGYVIVWLAALAGAATPIVGSATILYNVLLKDVLDQLVPMPAETVPDEDAPVEEIAPEPPKIE